RSSAPGSLSDEAFTTADVPRTIATCPASTAPPPMRPACWSSGVAKTSGRCPGARPASRATVSDSGPIGPNSSTIRGNCSRAMRQDPLRPLPVRVRQLGFILDQVAETVADRPGAADVGTDFLLAPQPCQAALVILGQGLIIPTNRAAHLHVVAVDPPGRVVRG